LGASFVWMGCAKVIKYPETTEAEKSTLYGSTTIHNRNVRSWAAPKTRYGGESQSEEMETLEIMDALFCFGDCCRCGNRLF